MSAVATATGVADVKLSDEAQRSRAALKEAIESNHPLVTKALEQERGRRQRQVQEGTALIEAQAATVKEKSTELSLADIKKKVSDKLALDAKLIAELNSAIEALDPSAKGKLGIPVKSSKTHITIAGAQQMLDTPGVFERVFYGQVPAGYELDYQPGAITLLGDSSTRFGTGKGAFHETLALATYLTCIGKDHISDINLLSSEVGPWHRRSAIVYGHPLPGVDFSKLNPLFSKFTYLVQDAATVAAPVYSVMHVSGGYDFGGGRQPGITLPSNSTNPWEPLDCSAWIAKLTGSRIIYTTADQVCFDRAYRYRLIINSTRTVLNNELNTRINAQTPMIVPKDWIIGPEFSVMDALYEPVQQIRDPQRDIQPGQIYAHRRFNDMHENLGLRCVGTGGHTGLVLGFISDAAKSRIQVLSYERDLEGTKKIVGFGVSEFPFDPNESIPSEKGLHKDLYFSRLATQASSAKPGVTDKSATAAAATAAGTDPKLGTAAATAAAAPYVKK